MVMAKRNVPGIQGRNRTAEHVTMAIMCLIFPGTAFGFSQVHAQNQPLSDIELLRRVNDAIADGTSYLRRRQNPNGSWTASHKHYSDNTAGLTALAVLAQLNCDVPVGSPQLKKALGYLRSVRLTDIPPKTATYEVSILLMALCAAREYDTDRQHIHKLVRVLQDAQETDGKTKGLWGYDLDPNTGQDGHADRSNGQFAVLALRDAANAGVEVDIEVWKRVREHWETKQNPDGGWSYHTPDITRGINAESRGSMTVAGLSTLAITDRMIHDDSDTDADGRVDCCSPHPPSAALTNGHNWLSVRGRFSTRSNPSFGQRHLFYYLYGLERAGRLTGVRFFGPDDWYRSGSRFLVNEQHADGGWSYTTCPEPMLATNYALLFLSKGLSRVVVNKLDYTSNALIPDPGGEWNQHHLDIPNLIDHIDSTVDQGWPPRLNHQVVTLSKLQESSAVADLMQAPVLYISGRPAPVFSNQQVTWLRKYIDEGGFIYAQANCQDGTFDEGFRHLVTRMFPDEEASLERLQADHPIYRSQHLLNSDNLELYGVDFGCRTSVVYSPEDHGCYWHKWMRHPPRDRSPSLTQRIVRSVRLGVNIIAYATGKEPPEKLNNPGSDGEQSQDPAARGLLEIAQLRHDGGWDTAPRAVKNLLEGLKTTTGAAVSLKHRPVSVKLESLTRFPLVWMHGRLGFNLQSVERNALRDYLSRGPLLLADACCGSKQFDVSFRDLMQQIFPDHPLEPIPPDHRMFSEATLFDVSNVRRRQLETQSKTASIRSRIDTGPPRFEGIHINGQYLVIYSQYDLSCALENQASLACNGYLKEDAMKLAMNLVVYALDQEITLEPQSAGVD